jgi:hypothetical protein
MPRHPVRHQLPLKKELIMSSRFIKNIFGMLVAGVLAAQAFGADTVILSRDQALSELKAREENYAAYYEREKAFLRETLAPSLYLLGELELRQLETFEKYKQALNARDGGINLDLWATEAQDRLRPDKLIIQSLASKIEHFDAITQAKYPALRQRLDAISGAWLRLWTLSQSRIAEHQLRLPPKGKAYVPSPRAPLLLKQEDYKGRLNILRQYARMAAADSRYGLSRRIRQQFENLLSEPRDFELTLAQVDLLRREWKSYEVSASAAAIQLRRLHSGLQTGVCLRALSQIDRKAARLAFGRIMAGADDAHPGSFDVAERMLVILGQRCMQSKVSVSHYATLSSSLALAQSRLLSQVREFVSESSERLSEASDSHEGPINMDPSINDLTADAKRSIENDVRHDARDSGWGGSSGRTTVSNDRGEKMTIEWSATKETAYERQSILPESVPAPVERIVLHAKYYYEGPHPGANAGEAATTENHSPVAPSIAAPSQSLPDRLSPGDNPHSIQKDAHTLSTTVGSQDPEISQRAQNLSDRVEHGSAELERASNEVMTQIAPTRDISPIGAPSVATRSLEPIRLFPESNSMPATSTALPGLVDASQRVQDSLQLWDMQKDSLGLSPAQREDLDRRLMAARKLSEQGLQALAESSSLAAAELLQKSAEILESAAPALTRVGVGLIPLVGDLADLTEMITGRDLITGEDIGASGRVLAAVGVIIGSRTVNEVLLHEAAVGARVSKEAFSKVAGDFAVYLESFTGAGDTLRVGAESLANPRNHQKAAETALHTVESLMKGESVKVYVAMEEKFAANVLSDGLGNSDQIQFLLREGAASRVPYARSVGLSVETVEKEVLRNGVGSKTYQILEFNYRPQNLSDMKIMPSIRSSEGGVVIHHTNLDSINEAFTSGKVFDFIPKR